MKLTIERSRWLRGEGDQVSRLLRPSDGKMCCLGFMACQLGYTEAEISNGETPMSAVRVAQKNLWPENMIHEDLDFSSLIEVGGKSYAQELVVRSLMETNDLEFVSASETSREDILTSLFKSINIEVEFVD